MQKLGGLQKTCPLHELLSGFSKAAYVSLLLLFSFSKLVGGGGGAPDAVTDNMVTYWLGSAVLSSMKV